MRGLWQLLFCIGALALVTRCQEDEESVDDGGEDESEESEGEEEGEEQDDGGHPSDDDAETLDPERVQVMHKAIDMDGDGLISMAEIMDYAKATRKIMSEKKESMDEHMEMMDQDKDGKVSLEEFYGDNTVEPSEDASEKEKLTEKAIHELDLAKFKAADKSGDGFLDITELPAITFPETNAELLELMTKHTLKTKDANGDGMLDLKEFWEYDGWENAETVDAEMREQNAKEFKNLDLDGNGKLDINEIEKHESGDSYTKMAMDDLFETVDTNKDGRLSLEELHERLPELEGTEAASHFMEWMDSNEL